MFGVSRSAGPNSPVACGEGVMARSFSQLEEDFERVLREMALFPESERRRTLLGELLILIEEADKLCLNGVSDLT
jgi:hypothetical protein